MRRTASEIIRNLEMRIARLEEQSLDLNDITVKIESNWEWKEGSRLKEKSHVYYEGGLKTWSVFTNYLEKALEHTKQIQIEKERVPEDTYNYPRRLQFDYTAMKSIWLVKGRKDTETNVFVTLHHGKTIIDSDNYPNIWADFKDAVTKAVKRVR